MMSGVLTKNIVIQHKEEHWSFSLLAWLFCISVFLLPPIKFNSIIPALFGTDILLPIIAIVTLKRVLEYNFIINNKTTLYTLIFILCIVFSIAINKRWGVFSDWFEIYKLIKFLIITIYSAICLSRLSLDKIFRTIFICVVIFNALHYFNVLDFNSHIEVYYGSEIQVNSFGLNSLGQPSTRRILGTLGNPNNNALLMLFFVVYFLKPTENKSKSIYYYLSVFMVLACQSRTGFFALLIVLILSELFYKQTIKKVIKDLVIYIFMYTFLVIGGNIYINSLEDISFIKQSFVEGRISMWIKLLNMWKFQPLFGYGPNKEYFYSRKWYSEGEHVLMLWRYGIVGFIAYILWLTYPIVVLSKKMKQLTDNEFKALAFSIVILIGTITNNPTCEFSLLMMFAMTTGLLFSPNSIKPA